MAKVIQGIMEFPAEVDNPQRDKITQVMQALGIPVEFSGDLVTATIAPEQVIAIRALFTDLLKLSKVSEEDTDGQDMEAEL